MTVVIKETMKCKLKDDLEIVQKVKELATGIFELTEKTKKAGIPTLMSLHRQSKARKTWMLDIEFVGMEKLGGKMGEIGGDSADKVNATVNKIGKKVFGKDNFDCDKSLGKGTGPVTLGYNVVTTCKINLPEPPPMKENFRYQGKDLKQWSLLKEANELEVNWKDAISRQERVIGVTVVNEFGQGFMDSDLHKIREAYYWEWCDTRD